MTQFVAHIAAAAVIALTGLSTAAHAAPAPARIEMSKINLSSAEGVATFKNRVASMERRFCSAAQKRSMNDAAACRAAIRAEIVDQLTTQQRLALSGDTLNVAQR